jgi:hypothetical protein
MGKRYEFRPEQGGRNRYIGSWSETTPQAVPLQWSAASLQTVLAWGADPDSSPYSHQSIAHWCDQFTVAHMDADLQDDAELQRALAIATVVDCQWDLYLANTYSLDQLQQLDFSSVRLPLDWFRSWQDQLGSR